MSVPKMHLERYLGSSMPACGLDEEKVDLDILDEDQALEWVPDSNYELCKNCLRTSAGRETLRHYRQMYQLRLGDERDREERR